MAVITRGDGSRKDRTHIIQETLRVLLQYSRAYLLVVKSAHLSELEHFSSRRLCIKGIGDLPSQIDSLPQLLSGSYLCTLHGSGRRRVWSIV